LQMAEPKLRPFHHLLVIGIICSFYGFVGLIFLLISVIRNGPRKTFYQKDRSVKPAVLSSNALGTHKFVRLKGSGIKLHYVISGPEDKPVMLFLHGVIECWYAWRHQIKEFSSNYRVVALDLRGFGDSDKPRHVSDYFVGKLTDDVREFITELGCQKCIVVGQDWGGVIGWRLAHLYGDVIDKLILLNATHSAIWEEVLLSTWKQFFMSWYVFFFQVPILPNILLRINDLQAVRQLLCGPKSGVKQGAVSEDDLEVVKYGLNNYDDWIAPLGYYRGALRYQGIGLREPKITSPVLLIWGTKEVTLHRRIAELSKTCAYNCTVKYVDGACHWVHHDEPIQVNNLIKEFLSKHS